MYGLVARPLPRQVHIKMQTTSGMKRRISTALLLTAAISGCSTDKKADAAQPAVVKEGSVAPRSTVVSVPSRRYEAIAVTNGAKLTGTVDFDGAIPRDSVVALPEGHSGCGQSVTHRMVDHSGTRIGGTVVWLADIRSGKPLPIERRFEIKNEGCLLNPRVQAVFAPGTLNFASEDVALHRNRIINVGTGRPRASPLSTTTARWFPSIGCWTNRSNSK